MDTIAATAKQLDELFLPWNRSDAPGLIVGVAQRGRSIYRKGWGLASVEHGTVNTPQTKMRIGSTSKHFAALAVLLLAESGQVDIDSAVRTYLPELSGPVGDPTLRHLMNHTGGLRDPYDLPGVLLCSGFPGLIPSGAGLELSQRFTSANYAPGERMVYCNNGYHLLSLLVERVSGKSFAEFLRQFILAPLGLSDTCLLTSDMTILPGIASFHMPNPDGSYRRGIYPSEELLGSGGMVSTLDDMLRWLAHLRGEKIVGSARTWELMLERPRYSSGVDGDYCLGLVREPYRGVEIVHHAGAVLGCTCQMLTVPEHQLDIIVIFNRMDGSAPTMALKVVDTVLANAGLTPAVAHLPAEGHQDLVGHWYSAASHRLFGIEAHPVPGQAPALALSVHRQLMGFLKPSDLGLKMSCSAHGTVEVCLPPAGTAVPDCLEFTDSGHRESFIRLPAVAPTVAEIGTDLVGRYRYADFATDLVVVKDGDRLYLDLCPDYGQSRLQMEPLSEDVCGFKLTGTGPIPLASLGTVSIARHLGRVSGLWLNSARTRDLWLERCLPD